MTPQRPNLILIKADDHRFSALSALGTAEVETPNLDRLAGAGTLFTGAHNQGSTHVAVCMPSRAMLLTGRSLFALSHHGGVIPENHLTFPEVFRRAGYLTCQIGKWHHDRASHGRLFATARKIFGFGNTLWYEGCNGHWHTPVYDWDPTGQYAAEAIYHDPPIEPFERPFERTKEHGRHSAAVLTDAAIDFIRERDAAADGRPFLLNLYHLAPHDPRQFPAEYAARYAPERITLPPNFRTTHPFDNGEMTVRDELLEGQPRRPEIIRQTIGDYYASIAHLDFQIGRLLDAVAATSSAQNTIIVYMSDHGLSCGQHGLLGKQNLYDHSVRIPLIMAGPGIPAGQQRAALCYLMDLNPTLCELAGLPPAPGMDARSLTPVLHNPGTRIRDALHLAYRGVQRAVRSGDLKLIEYVVGGRRATQLFHVGDDPFETRNLADLPEHADAVVLLRHQLRRWREEFGDSRAEGDAFWNHFDSPTMLGRWKPGMHVHEPV